MARFSVPMQEGKYIKTNRTSMFTENFIEISTQEVKVEKQVNMQEKYCNIDQHKTIYKHET